MHKISKRFLLAVSVALVVAGLAWAALVAGSVGGREQMELALQRQCGVPVKISALHYSLWSGFRATGVTLELPAPTGDCAPSSVSVPVITAKVGFWPLFSGRVVIRQLVFRDPSVVWVEAEKGSWGACLREKPPKAPVSEGSDAQGNPPLSEATPKPAKSPKARKNAETKEACNTPEFQIQSIRIKNALFRFVDRQGRTSALVEGVAALGRLDARLSRAEGKLAISRLTLRDGACLEDLEAPFLLENGLLTLPAIKTRLADGSVWGSATAACRPGPAAFTLDLQFDGVSLNHLLTDMGQAPRGQGRTVGVLRGSLDVYAMTPDMKSIRGFGQLQISNGRMEQFPLFQMIGKVLSIEELKDVALQQAQLDLRADDGKVHVDSLVMESQNLRLTASGASGWDGKLALAASLDVNAKVQRQLPGWVLANFHPAASGGDRKAIDFAIGGTLSRPNTDLMRVMVGRKVGDQLMNLWKSLTGKPKKGADDGKKKSGGAPPAEEKDSADEDAPAGKGN